MYVGAGAALHDACDDEDCDASVFDDEGCESVRQGSVRIGCKRTLHIGSSCTFKFFMCVGGRLRS